MIFISGGTGYFGFFCGYFGYFGYFGFFFWFFTCLWNKWCSRISWTIKSAGCGPVESAYVCFFATLLFNEWNWIFWWLELFHHVSHWLNKRIAQIIFRYVVHFIAHLIWLMKLIIKIQCNMKWNMTQYEMGCRNLHIGNSTCVEHVLCTYYMCVDRVTFKVVQVYVHKLHLIRLVEISHTTHKSWLRMISNKLSIAWWNWPS